MTTTAPVCRSCGHQHLEPVLDLGRVPLANSLPTAEDIRNGEEERFPLALFFCPECSLVQIGESVNPKKLFSEYLYASSFSETMLAHASALVERLVEERALGEGHRVIEIASNDGYLLQYYKQRGIEVLGIEPAANIARMATEEKGIPTLVEFFGAELGDRLSADGVKADVMHAHNVFAHVPDPRSFVAGLKKVLKPNGVVVIEAPYLGEFIDKLEFDTIYHEHFSYFSLSAVNHLVKRYGLMLADVELVPIHGGSLRMFIAHEGAAAPSGNVEKMLAEEERRGMKDTAFYRDFADRVRKLGEELNALLRNFKSEGKRIAAYGASAKGSTLMNTYGIGASEIDFVADRSTLKQGRLTPGNHLPILPPEALMEKRPDYALLLTWNFADEILRQQQEWRDQGGKFIIPLPELQIV
jgi:SAM-dependent methyltransferase